MTSLIEYFDCGNVYSTKDAIYFRVGKFSDIVEKIIPFFEKYPILGVKYQDFKDFCWVAKIMKEKGHLGLALDQILKIKTGMNSGRTSEAS